MTTTKIASDGRGVATAAAKHEICDLCGREVTVGEWPWCPHGFGRMAVVPDDIPGGETVQNFGPEPVTYYSRSERRRIMRERGLSEVVKHVGLPGSDKSAHTSRWV